MSQLLLDITPNNPFTLANFVTGRNQELLAALHLALTSANGERCFYIWGELGCGKSHLLQACIQQALSLQQAALYSLAAVPDNGDEFNIIALDDVEQLDDEAQIALFGLYNQMRDSGDMLIISGSQSPINLQLRNDLRTRLGWGMVYQLHSLSDEEKIHALEQHALSRGFTLTPEVSHYLLRHGRRDLPSLIAVLNALDQHSLRLHRTPSVPLLKEVLSRNPL